MVCRIIRTLLAVVAAGAAEAFLSPTVLARTFASADRHGACRRRPPRASVVLAQAGSDSDSDSSGLYAALRQRRSQLAARRSATQQERALVATLGETYQGITDIINAQRREERAVRDLWDHWFGEEGEDARRQLDAAEGDAPALLQLMDAFPDWAEPVNRLATHRFMEGLEAIRDGAGGARQDFEDSARLCLRVLRDKPWHFGALSGIVMVYAQMGNAEEANRVSRMLTLLDARLVQLQDMSEK